VGSEMCIRDRAYSVCPDAQIECQAKARIPMTTFALWKWLYLYIRQREQWQMVTACGGYLSLILEHLEI
jgi:hypothetical protein